MSVQITDPPDNGTFPDNPRGWTAIATIDSTDGVSGVLMDTNPNNPEGIYPGNGANPSGPDGSGIYTWEVPFEVDDTIQNMDPLLVQCYDSETFDDGVTHADTASEDGLAAHRHKKKPAGPAPTIDIDSADLSGSTVPVTVKLTPKTTGAIFLALLNYPAGAKRPTRKEVLVFPLLPSKDHTVRKHTFNGVDASQWTHICVIAVIKGHQGHPKRKWIKPAPK